MSVDLLLLVFALEAHWHTDSSSNQSLIIHFELILAFTSGSRLPL